jgi:hypothetical protein
MKATIEVSDRKEADAIRIGLSDPAVRAFVVIMGALNSLPTDRARVRVMDFIRDRFEEMSENAPKPTGDMT